MKYNTLEIYPNPLFNEEKEMFSHYEIMSCADYKDANGNTFTEPFMSDSTKENILGSVFYTIYGRQKDHGAESIGDFVTIDDARDTLVKMGVI